MNVKLLVVIGKTIKRQVAMKLPAVVGRSRTADVTVSHPLISRRHCEISEDNGLLMLRDLASLNGTMIGGRRIALAPLLPDSEFTIGPLTFRVLYEYDGDLESVPATCFVDGVEGADEAGPADPASVGVKEPSISKLDETLPAKPARKSESSEIVIPNFTDLADADPEAVLPARSLAPTQESPPFVRNASLWPPASIDNLPTVPLTDAMDEPLEVDSSLQSGSHHRESPWAVDPPLMEKLRQMPLASVGKEPPVQPETPPDTTSAETIAKSPPKEKPPANPPKKPSYGEEIDPEFGSFLESLE
ncbi:MAG: FHA domain-containing protein [Thermoguttaceae bacterium]